jgi:hypothetical protein
LENITLSPLSKIDPRNSCPEPGLSGDVALVDRKALRRHASHRGPSGSKSRRQAATAYGGLTNATGAASYGTSIGRSVAQLGSKLA